jgi:hypothetical protein
MHALSISYHDYKKIFQLKTSILIKNQAIDNISI